jgi:hypothetical protein
VPRRLDAQGRDDRTFMVAAVALHRVVGVARDGPYVAEGGESVTENRGYQIHVGLSAWRIPARLG